MGPLVGCVMQAQEEPGTCGLEQTSLMSLRVVPQSLFPTFTKQQKKAYQMLVSLYETLV